MSSEQYTPDRLSPVKVTDIVTSTGMYKIGDPKAWSSHKYTIREVEREGEVHYKIVPK